MSKIITTAESSLLTSFFTHIKGTRGIDLSGDFAEFVNNKADHVAADKIIEIVSSYFKIQPDEVRSKRRYQNLVEARGCICYLLRQSGETWRNIGLLMGGRDHSTVLVAVDRFNDLVDFDKAFRARFVQIQAQLKLYGYDFTA